MHQLPGPPGALLMVIDTRALIYRTLERLERLLSEQDSNNENLHYEIRVLSRSIRAMDRTIYDFES